MWDELPGASSAQEERRPPTAEAYLRIAERLTFGKLVLFLGPDTILSSRPSAAKWDRDLGFPPTDLELAGFLAHGQALSFDISSSFHLVGVASFIEARYGRSALQWRLREAFHGRSNPTEVYRYVANIPAPTVIVTTNYDDSLEQAFIEANHPFCTLSPIANPVDVERWGELGGDLQWLWRNLRETKEIRLEDFQLDGQNTLIIKLRGSFGPVSPERSSFVITDDDYLRVVVGLSKQKAWPWSLVEYLRDSSFLFLGYGLPNWEWALMLKSLMGALDVEPQHRKSWVIQANPSKIGATFWRTRTADVYDQRLNGFVDALAHAEHAIIEDSVRRMLDSNFRPTVFISYAREDAINGKAIYTTLKEAGFKVWRDKEKILAGEEWDPKIRQSLKNSDFVLMCLSNNSIVKRGYIQKEMRMALDIAEEFPLGQVFLIPVRFDKCHIPPELTRYQYVDWFNPDGPNQLVRSIAVNWQRRNLHR